MNLTDSLFRSPAKFIAGAATISRLPKILLPEVAFFGKSNVGKSTLINSLCNHKTLAKTSRTPGRTQQINFFSILDKIIIVDLPGYGFAKVPMSVKAQWHQLIDYYFANRSNLKLINLLIDARRMIQDHDHKMIALFIALNLKFQIIFTKTDKISHEAYLKLIENTERFFVQNNYKQCNIIATSAKNKHIGVKTLQRSIILELRAQNLESKL
jgi:GTP-binding protein